MEHLMQTETNNKTPYNIGGEPGKRKNILLRIPKKVYVIALIVFALFLFNKSEFFDLAIVSIRWGQPMVYKAHLQSGAIWDLTSRPYRVFAAYPLGGDPEKDEFCIMGDKGVFLTLPKDVYDGYFYIYKRDEIEAEALRIAKKAGFEDETSIKVKSSIKAATVQQFNQTTSLTDCISKIGKNISIRYYTYETANISEEELKKRFDKILSQWDEYGQKMDKISITVYADQEYFNSTNGFSQPDNSKYTLLIRTAYDEEARVEVFE